MGQAKKRGTPEQRREQAIASQRKEPYYVATQTGGYMGPPQFRAQKGASIIVAALALALHGK